MITVAVLELPSVLSWSALNPVAVLKLPSVLRISAATPVAVFSLPVVLAAERTNSSGRILVTSTGGIVN